MPLLSVVELSKGSIWKPNPWEAPYLIAQPGETFPDGSAAHITFSDTAGGELATFQDSGVTPSAITFLQPETDMDLIPAGSNFEIYLDTEFGPQKIRYGKVIRREITLTTPPAGVTTAALFTEPFTLAGRLRSSWKWLRSHPYVDANVSLPNGLTNEVENVTAVVRWIDPVNSDTVSVNVSLLNQGGGKTRVRLCGDNRLASFLAVEWEEPAHLIHFCVGTTLTTVAYQGSSISNTVVDGDNYTVSYNDATKTLSVYKGADMTPLGSWVDTLAIVPHGPGYRYLGLDVLPASAYNGVQVTSWTAKDGV